MRGSLKALKFLTAFYPRAELFMKWNTKTTEKGEKLLARNRKKGCFHKKSFIYLKVGKAGSGTYFSFPPRK
jgi:hypothetical protein